MARARDDDFTTTKRLVEEDYENHLMAEQERNDFDEPDDLPPPDADPTSKDDLNNGNAAENEAEPSWDALSPEEQEAIMEDEEAADRHSTDTFFQQSIPDGPRTVLKQD